MAIHPDDRKAVEGLIGDLQLLEGRAHRLGMHVTAHALNRAKNAAGWELAGDVEQCRESVPSNQEN
jgi:hypothetical protein